MPILIEFITDHYKQIRLLIGYLTSGEVFYVSYALYLCSCYLIGGFMRILLRKLAILWRYPRYWRSIFGCPFGEPLHHHHDGCPACDSFDEHTTC